MVGETFFIKQNDTAPAIIEILTLSGVPIDLTGILSLKFHLRPREGGAMKVNANALVVAPATNGKVRYTWINGDTNTSGQFKREWEIQFADGTFLTVPNDVDGYPVSITDDLV